MGDHLPTWQTTHLGTEKSRLEAHSFNVRGPCQIQGATSGFPLSKSGKSSARLHSMHAIFQSRNPHMMQLLKYDVQFDQYYNKSQSGHTNFQIPSK